MYSEKKYLRFPHSVAAVCLLLMFVTFCRAGGTWKHLVPQYSLTAIAASEDGYWFATPSGALRYDTLAQRWHRYNKDTGHMNQNHNVNAMKIMLGRVWFATNYGMYSCSTDGSGWKQHILPGDYFSNWVRGFDAHGSKVYIAAFTGLHTYTPSEGEFTAYDIALPDNYQTGYTTCIAADDSLVWIGTDDGVFRYDTALPLSDPESREYFGKGSGFDTASDLVMCRTITVTEQGVWFGLDEYTPSDAPNYCRGGLFHKQGELWKKYDRSNGLPAGGIHFVHAYGDKMYAGLFHYVNGVDFRGAGLLTVDTADASARVLSADDWFPDTDDIRAFYCNAGDTLVGTETGLFTNAAQFRDMKPYQAPAWFSVRNIGGARVEFNIDTVALATAYTVYYSTDERSFRDSLVLSAPRDTAEIFSAGQRYYFRAAGMNGSGVGKRCNDVLGCTVTDSANPVLIVQAFEKTMPENDFSHVVRHGKALSSYGKGYDAASAGAIGKGSLSLRQYDMVDWVSGMDNKSLNDVSMTAISDYLESGGKLFISGSHLLENLAGTAAYPSFNETYLKARAKKLNTDTYTVIPLQDGIFNGVETIAYGEGEEAAYSVSRPDGFSPVGSAGSSLFYHEKDSSSYGSAALHYTGSFGSSDTVGALVYLGFPYETVYPDSLRNAMMGCILDHFGYDVALTSVAGTDLLEECDLAPNYPNPFNAVTTVRFSVARSGRVDIAVFSLAGEKVAELTRKHYEPGEYTVNFDAGQYPSGIYICRLRTGATLRTRKMLLVK